jgi:predicted nuclease with TOPRIM domain
MSKSIEELWAEKNAALKEAYERIKSLEKDKLELQKMGESLAEDCFDLALKAEKVQASRDYYKVECENLQKKVKEGL